MTSYLDRRFRHSIHPSKWQSTPCPCGTNIWHVMALGLLKTSVAREQLEATIPVRGGDLLDDMLEHTTAPIEPTWWFLAGYNHAFSVAAPTFLGMSVEQICLRQGTTLLGHYWVHGVLDWPMHPVVLAYEAWLGSEIERRR